MTETPTALLDIPRDLAQQEVRAPFNAQEILFYLDHLETLLQTHAPLFESKLPSAEWQRGIGVVRAALQDQFKDLSVALPRPNQVGVKLSDLICTPIDQSVRGSHEEALGQYLRDPAVVQVRWFLQQYLGLRRGVLNHSGFDQGLPVLLENSVATVDINMLRNSFMIPNSGPAMPDSTISRMHKVFPSLQLSDLRPIFTAMGLQVFDLVRSNALHASGAAPAAPAPATEVRVAPKAIEAVPVTSDLAQGVQVMGLGFEGSFNRAIEELSSLVTGLKDQRAPFGTLKNPDEVEAQKAEAERVIREAEAALAAFQERKATTIQSLNQLLLEIGQSGTGLNPDAEKAFDEKEKGLTDTLENARRTLATTIQELEGLREQFEAAAALDTKIQDIEARLSGLRALSAEVSQIRVKALSLLP
ncbi:MAG: hypothetical protein WC777_01075 [Candidatus Gracilibacteria bacterium]|jgi:hypothetical protein